MDLPICLVVGASDHMTHQGALFSYLPFDHQPNVHVVKQDELFAAFQVGLHCFVFIHRPGQAKRKKAGEGKRLPGARFVFRDEPPGDRNVHFEQATHTMLRLGQVEHVDHHAALR
jgi:hypothetical protein